MFKNYFISAIRNITKNKFYAFLNIIGLTVGFAAFIFLFLFLNNELTYDKYHVNHERIYRLESDFTIGTKHDKFAIVPIPMGPALKLEYPEIQEFVRFRNADNVLIRIGDKEYFEENIYFSDSTIFDVFTHQLVIGNLTRSLAEPNTAVLTNKLAHKYFGKENPIGQVFETGGGDNYKVTAVIEDLPGNSHVRFEGLLSVSTLAKQEGEEQFNSMEPGMFWNIGVYTYVLINKNSNIDAIHEKFPGFYDKYMKSVGEQFNASFDLLTTPLADIHLNSTLSADLPTGNEAYVYIFSVVAVFILLIAAINYMNMATARSSERSREVGMRKVMGAEKGQLVGQFISESILLSLIALILALCTVYLLIPDFNGLAGKDLSFDVIGNPLLLLQVFVVAILIGIVSGSYPAFYLSSFMPIKVLKGMTGASGKANLYLRRGLVIFQFFMAIVLIIATIVVSEQLQFLKNKDLGFIRENMVVMELQDSAFRSKVEPLREKLLQHPAIESVANSTGVPGRNSWIQVMLVEQETEMNEFAVILTQCDYHYPELMGFTFLEGRDFDENMGTDDTAAVIVNEMAVKQFGWGENPIGKKFRYGFDLDGSGGRIMKVIGVVKNYHFNSLHNKIEPIIVFISQYPRYFLTARIKENQMSSALGYMEESWTEFGAKRPFNFTMLSDIQEEMYQGEQKIAAIFMIMSILTVFIALLGLFGLSSFSTEQRTREIGIRKVNGATVGDIILLLYREFFWLILIAFIIAIPIAAWRLTIWLETSFIYYTAIHWYSVAIAGALALIVGLTTITYHVLKSASANPVESLNYE